jgi:hypothetical protein
LFVRNRLIIGRKWGTSWLFLTPRIFGYIIRAALNGRLEATMSGIRAARAADPPCRRKMPKAMRKYLVLNETRHRGSWLDRARTEVLGRVKVDPG